MRTLRKGEDPRQVFGDLHRERGPQLFTYSYEDVAGLIGVGVDRAKQLVALAPGDSHLERVAFAVASRAVARSGPVGDDELEQAFGSEREAELWMRRWPRLQLYKCAVASCKMWLLCYPGRCRDHGDAHPAIRLRPRRRDGAPAGHIEVHVGDSYVPLHRLIVDAARGMQVHHLDGNRFNNRPANLRAMTLEMHRLMHAASTLDPARRAQWLNRIEQLADEEKDKEPTT